MHPGTLRTLEFDRIVAAVADLAVTPMGRAEVEALTPLTSAQAGGGRVERHDRRRSLPGGAPGISAARAGGTGGRPRGAGHDGRALEPLRLLGLSEFLESIEQTRRAVAQAGSTLPYLMRLVEGVASFRNEIADVRRKIEPSGEVADNASPALASIRERLRRQRGKLRSTLESFLRERETSKYLQEQVVTDRNGRYVLMVRVRAPRRDSGHRARRVGQRSQPVPRAAGHGGHQQRDRRARGAGGRGGPAHPARADRRVSCAAGRLGAHDRRGNGARRRAGEGAVLATTGGVEPSLSSDGALELVGARHPLLLLRREARLGPGRRHA